MNKQQKQVQQQLINNEKAVLNQLKDNYKNAITEINQRLQYLITRSDADMQHVVYQINYQKQLLEQTTAIYDKLHENNYNSISEYLKACYEDSFIGTMYDLQGQGIPLVLPIDQEQVVKAIQHETKLSEGLYKRLGKDVKQLQKQIAGEISRGISDGQMYNEIARNISNACNLTRNKSMVIARTEGHRIQCKATSDAQHKAKEKGADIVKQWDASLDDKTRDTHRKLDGQIREIDEPFEVDGMKAQEPGGFGRPEEDINCRCALLQRARWALDTDDYTKYDPKQPELIDDRGAVQLITIDSKNYEDFKKQYRSSLSAMDQFPNYDQKGIDRIFEQMKG